MVATSQMILLTIQAGVRLYNAGRGVYIQNTLDRAITLPLPSGPGITAAAARNFFNNAERGKKIAEQEENQRIRELLSKGRYLTQDEESEFLLIYRAFKFETDPGNVASLKDNETRGNELVAILTIRNWHEDRPGPSNFQLIAGTLVNIAIDYFAYTPAAISDKRPEGKALKHFLEALDRTDFSVKPPADVIGDVMLAVIDSVAQTPALIGNSKTEKVLVENVAQTLSLSAEKYLAESPSSERWDGREWLQMISHAIIQGGAETVLANPEGVLGVGKKEGAVIKIVGESIADLLIGESTVDIKPLLSGEGLETVVKSFLAAVSKNPEFIKIGNQGLKNLLVSVAEELSLADNLYTEDIFPKLAGMILLHSADNLELIWQEGAEDPEKHLLVTATRLLLKKLSEGMADGSLPRLNREDIIAIAETVFDEVLENREWIIGEVEGNPRLGTAVEAVLAALAEQERVKRLNSHTFMLALRAGINASAMQLSLLDTLAGAGTDQGKIVLTAAIDAIFDGLMGDDVSEEAQWRRARLSAINTALGIGLAKLSRVMAATQNHINVLRTNIGVLIDEQISVDEFAERLGTLLSEA